MIVPVEALYAYGDSYVHLEAVPPEHATHWIVTNIKIRQYRRPRQAIFDTAEKATDVVTVRYAAQKILGRPGVVPSTEIWYPRAHHEKEPDL